ncbi:uncharacterized protein LOC132201505 [Neocloeon triangulifer]|uniref:uncharacterized protein LOC132201505 n=1 Tax=Neocloeon triangulifer TaxID=2078957 RepID=UPI00286F7594|nr:uncharacterized protein LOC132201505 [Neocloeon triangulifer]
MSSDMGACLCIAKLDETGEAREEAEEQLDGASPGLSLQPLLQQEQPALGDTSDQLATVATDGRKVWMSNREVEHIRKNLDEMVEVTDYIYMERIAAELKDLGAAINPSDYCTPQMKADDQWRKDLARKFYLELQYLEMENVYDLVSKICARLDYHPVNRFLLPLTALPPPVHTRQLSEDPNMMMGDIDVGDHSESIGENVAGPTNIMTEEQKRMIERNIDTLVDNISNANLKDVIRFLDNFIPEDDKAVFLSDTTDLRSRAKSFFEFVPYMLCEDPFEQLSVAFMRTKNDVVTNVLKKEFPLPTRTRDNSPNSRSPSEPQGARAFHFPPDYLEEMSEERKQDFKNNKFDDDAAVLVEQSLALDPEARDRLDLNRFKIKPARIRMDSKGIGKQEEVYDCGTNPKGYALILNIHNYPDYDGDEEDRERKGSQVDTLAMTKLFNELGYIVELYPNNFTDNVSQEDFKKVITRFAKKREHFHVDSCFVVIMAHGEQLETSGRGNVIITSDNKPVPITWISSQFSAEKCQLLIGKPKIFMYQCCRGRTNISRQINHYHKGPATPSTAKTDGKGSVPEGEKVISKKFERQIDDILICHAAPQGYVAHRDTKVGSTFIQAIIDVFVKHAHEKHVVGMMKEVDKLIKSQSISQTVSIEILGFTKKLYLHPHLYDKKN